MIILGLSGSIAMGKSTVAAMFRQRRIPVFDADHSARRHAAADGEGFAAIVAAFPEAFSDGRLDRQRLAQRVFADPVALRRLQAILHPLVRRDRERFLRRLRRQGCRLVVLDIPLLYESGADRRCDRVVVVSAPGFVQRRRLLTRPGMDRRLMGRILARQMPDARKRRRADFILPTGGSLGRTRRAVDLLLQTLRTDPGRPGGAAARFITPVR